MFLVWAAGKVVAVLLWRQGGSPYIAAAAFFLPDVVLLYQLLAPSAQWVCRVFTHFATDRPEICLTIDDGPDEEDTPRILDLLDRHGARATFFLIGERAVRHPDLVAEIRRRGHEIGHHTHTHPLESFWCAGPLRVRAELDGSLPLFQSVSSRWFRPPAGIKSFFLARALAERDLRCVGWSVRSRDTMSRDPGAVAERVMKRVQPGSIVLMHEGASLDPRVRVRALELLLEGLAARRFACVTPRLEQLR